MIKFDASKLAQIPDLPDFNKTIAEMKGFAETLHNGTGAGSDMLGWLELPRKSKADAFTIEKIASQIKSEDATLICIGIGGSYLGAEAVISALNPLAKVVFAGHHLEPGYLMDIMDWIDDGPVYLNVISKSGTTTEPGLVFRILLKWLKKRYPKDWADHIIATTDPESGALRAMAQSQNFTTFSIPPDVGGRFSVLTPVGLFPIAAAGLDIGALLNGASKMAKALKTDRSENNPAYQLAAVRTELYRAGYKIEALASFNPRLRQFAEWWKQLAGESEGKEHQGIFPASCIYTTDLHSLGQWVQEGERTIMETFLWFEKPANDLVIPAAGDEDGLGYLEGRSMAEIQGLVKDAVMDAHTQGGVPCSLVSVPALDEYHLGGLLYFFEYVVALTGYALGVNPFNQPGVEAYKQEMFRRLGKPGA